MVCLGAGCSPPQTDIVATVSEDVGPFDIADARAEGDQLSARVCVANADAAEKVVDRVLLQLRNKGYQRIELDVIAEGGERQLVVWTPAGRQAQPSTAGGDNPCAPQGENPETAEAAHN